jgi:hypothetical protein
MKKLALTVGVLAFPLVSFAQLGNVQSIIQQIGNIINMLIPIVFTLALLIFFWGLVKYLWGKEQDKEAAKKTMIWGVVALFVMAAVWGLVAFLGSALGIDQNAAPTVGNLIPR